MQSYRLSTNLKSGLVIFAVLIAVASLWYTSRLVDQLRAREFTAIEIWAEAMGAITKTQTETINPHQPDFQELLQFLEILGSGQSAEAPSSEKLAAFREAIRWAQSMPPAGETSFIANSIVLREDFTFTIPSIVSDDSGPTMWRNLPVDEQLESRDDSLEAMTALARYQAEMDEMNEPIPIEVISEPLGELRQQVHFGESKLIRELRIFPYVQLLFVGLFIFVGYAGFSYVRRNEQSSLWVGMAKEAAHQLGTPISSLMGWTQLMKTGELDAETQQSAIAEVEKDISRLQRVTNRFSNIGSRPQLKPTSVETLVAGVADYMRQRMPKQGRQIVLSEDIEPGLQAPMNTELFEWVIENLIKNALDALNEDPGLIQIRAYLDNKKINIEVEDNGKGIDRRQWKNVFRPGYSTKKRGWGLGLSLAKRIVEDYHGGELLLVQSKVNEGTTFRIELPAELS